MSQNPPPPVFTLRTAGGEITTLSFLHNENKLISGCSNGIVTVWCLQSFRKTSKWNGHGEKSILWIKCLNDTFFSQGRDGFVKKFRSHESQWIEDTKISFSSHGFCTCDICPSDDFVAVPEENGIRIVFSKDMTSVLDLTLPDTKRGMCMCLKMISSSQFKLLTGYEDGSMAAWDLRNPQKPMNDHKFYNDPIMCFDYNSEFGRGVCASVGDKIYVWSLTDDNFETIKCLTLKNSGIASIKMRKDQRIFASGGWDSRLRIFGLKHIKPLAVLNHHTDTIQCLEFSNCAIGEYNNLLAAGSKDRRISLWNLY